MNSSTTGTTSLVPGLWERPMPRGSASHPDSGGKYTPRRVHPVQTNGSRTGIPPKKKTGRVCALPAFMVLLLRAEDPPRAGFLPSHPLIGPHVHPAPVVPVEVLGRDGPAGVGIEIDEPDDAPVDVGAFIAEKM